ncbi:lipopolysaccharide biosynthesis protein [Sphingomonas sp. LaA6.9]|uniref:lipopolysaccharide biosynthesis protein n=1 Tax=Sphingomonas sp. LaA6.9 TaxID=2919914 RepID=UPI001F4F3487|nr:oligosaccharide flippase family protein [Sphingomonas sp. LaA6.9]MCJ8159695.1 oligosaccharide flippase family protein [Sphingomonas sp. LaA6.9]
MTNRRNFLAGVASSGWTALIGLLAVPWYIHYLGIEAYGMIGVYLTLQGIFLLLDLGLSPTVSREVARSMVSGTMPHARALINSMSLLFLLSGGVMAAGLAGLAPWLASKWLNAGSLPLDQVVISLALSAMTIGARWPATLYVGVLNGARRVDLVSGVTIASTTLANVGAVAVLAFVEPSLRAFFLWHALIGAFHSIAMRVAARHVVGGWSGTGFDWVVVKSIWRFSAGMAAVAATGILFSQIDKVVLMRTTTLDQIGHYTIATALASILYRLVTPAFNVVYPQLSGIFETGSTADLSRQYHDSTRRFLTIIFPAAMILIVCARPILSIWISDENIVDQTSTIVIFLSLGTAVHCAMYFPYALQIACGMTFVPLLTNIILSVIFIPAVFVLSSWMGAIGASIAWVILHFFYFILGTYLTDRYVLPGQGWPWVLHGVAPPLVISTGFGFAAAFVMPVIGSDVSRLFFGSICAMGALVIGGLMLPEGHAVLKRVTSGMTRR